MNLSTMSSGSDPAWSWITLHKSMDFACPRSLSCQRIPLVWIADPVSRTVYQTDTKLSPIWINLVFPWLSTQPQASHEELFYFNITSLIKIQEFEEGPSLVGSFVAPKNTWDLFFAQRYTEKLAVDFSMKCDFSFVTLMPCTMPSVPNCTRI